MTTTSHRDCPHPATKAARASCRRKRAAQVESDATLCGGIRTAYHAGAEVEELLGMISLLGLDIDPDLDIEEIIASLPH